MDPFFNFLFRIGSFSDFLFSILRDNIGHFSSFQDWIPDWIFFLGFDPLLDFLSRIRSLIGYFLLFSGLDPLLDAIASEVFRAALLMVLDHQPPSSITITILTNLYSRKNLVNISQNGSGINQNGVSLFP